ncbi:MAG: hypothetical protein ACRYFU_17700 [Janthinobacterium lividum]
MGHRAQFPENHHVRPKIQQQLKVPRDAGLLRFSGRGRYRLTSGRQDVCP